MQEVKIRNKKARINYILEERFIAGIQLYGTEIKSIRLGKASLVDSYCYMVKGELWLRMQITEYAFGTHNNHDPKRERKLLLTKKELEKIDRKTKQSGLTIIPTVLFLNNRGIAKIEIALAKGKKMHDKREDLKEKDSKREMDRLKKI